MTSGRLLVVEDDPEICEVIRDALTMEGHLVDVVNEGTGVAESLADGQYDLLVLDRMLPDAEGADLCRKLRDAGNGVLILMLTARDALEEKVEGLEAGADDYLTKPFAVSELVARVQSLLRRVGRLEPRPIVLRFGPLILDRAKATVEVDGRPLMLTATEFALLEALLAGASRVLSRTELLKEVWGYDFDPHTNNVEVYVSYLRRKLGKTTDRIVLRNVRGFGYTIEMAEGRDKGHP
ncbi:response regulator transcription factor [Cognatiyoonia sp. IB215182]|uniref:response regulator transcription factor n=1 Tax=Cognatiyoonia sp. IB215182 TaxID=3097353 RepID=UPI002A1694D8|nr:response regulator transcription factor [Cognatiyoonia sp. IB215182]MDX8355647.1 response regulator transcription factor [Cognatiyoonia sp. IB215182]